MGCLSSKDRLTKEDMEFLKTHTRYDEATIKEWYKGFKVSLAQPFILNDLTYTNMHCYLSCSKTVPTAV